MRDWVAAYLAEYQEPPHSTGDHEKANAYRYGYEAGVKAGREATLRDTARRLLEEADGPPPR